MPSGVLLSPVVTVDGQELDPAWSESLREIRVESEYQVPSRCDLRWVDEGWALLDADRVKLGSTIAVATSDGSATLFTGEVTSIGSEAGRRDAPELVAVAYDKTHRMGRANSVTSYTSMTVSDIVTQLANNSGVKASVDSTAATMDYLLQVDSDLGLLTELARHTGYDWWVDPHGTLHFAKPTSGPATIGLGYGAELIAFSVRVSGHAPDSVTVTGWDRKQQTMVSGVSSEASSGITPTAPIADAAKAGPFGTAAFTSASLVPQTATEAKDLSQAVLDRSASSAVSARGTCLEVPALAVGSRVSINGVGTRLAGTYPVTWVEHAYRPGQPLTSRFRAGDRLPHSLVETLAPSAPVRSPAFNHAGLVVGTVTNIKDDAGLGRVKVKLPGVSDNAEFPWARVVTPGGGNKRGNTFHPEVGDEVLVGFEGGDPRQPVVLGGLYGSKATIPPLLIGDSGLLAERTITSRQGHTFTITEGDGDAKKGGFAMKLNDSQTSMRLGADQYSLVVPAGNPVEITAGQASIAIAKSGDITISSPGNLTLKATGDLKLEGVNIKINAQAEVAVAGQASASLEGAQVKVTGNGMTQIKGGMVQIN